MLGAATQAQAQAYADPLAARLYEDRGNTEAIVRDFNSAINNRGASEGQQPRYEQHRYQQTLPGDPQD